jgi:myo-inositol-1(or 4)-monophosphatase
VSDPAALRDLARAVAHEGAALAREMRLGGIDVADTKTSAVDVVTEADRAVEELVRTRITSERPDDAILGEEGDDRPGTSGVRGGVAPSDGTVNGRGGLAGCAVSVASEVDGEVVAGAVVTIPTGVEYVAALGFGATRDGRPLAVRPTPPLAERLVLTGFGYQRAVREHQAACVARLLPEVRDIRRMGSCSRDLCHVAERSADGYGEAGPQPGDWSAGGLVLREAGGRFELLDGTLAFDGSGRRTVVVGAPADGWDTFVEALAASGFVA